VANRIAPLSEEEVAQVALSRNGFGAVPLMFAHLLGFSMAGTILGFFLPGTYPHPVSVIAIAAFGAGLALAAWRADWPARRSMLAMLALAGGIYLLIALGRAHVYQMFHVPPSRAASMSRFHYAGSVPVTVLWCLVLEQLGQFPWLRAVPRGLALAVGLGILVLGYRRFGLAIDERFACRDYFARTMREIAAAAAAAPAGVTVYVETLASPPYLLGSVMPDQLFPGRAAVFLLTHRSDSIDGRRMRFIERDPEVRVWYLNRPETRLARLLVGPEDAAGQP